jgi:hypothetical protein
VSKLTALGWRHRIELREGVESTYQWFLAHRDQARLDVRPEAERVDVRASVQK